MRIFFLLIAISFSFHFQAQNWNQINKFCASDRAADDWFGHSVSLSGNYAIVGAPYEDQDANGGAKLTNAGSAYIYKNDAGTWSQVQKIVASDRAVGDDFGFSVSICDDYAIVGAYFEDAGGGTAFERAGSAYIFKNIAGTWTQVQKIVASDRAAEDWFGFSVSISGDYAIVGAKQEDEDASGGATRGYAGSAYIFKNNAETWTQVQKIVASDRGFADRFGHSVSISGDYAIVGAIYENAFDGIALNATGSAYVFKNIEETWTQVQKLVASDRAQADRFGCSVSISGDHAIVGAYGKDEVISEATKLNSAGSAYFFKNEADHWTQNQKVVASDQTAYDNFGWSVSISGDYAVVGANQKNEYTSDAIKISVSGAAYTFKNDAGIWAQGQKIVASDKGANDNFGWSASISGDHIIVGAHLEDDDENGENTLSKAGSAYIFGIESGINLSGNSIAISNGATSPGGVNHTDFGSTNTNTSITRTFTIENTGVGILYLTGNPKISLTGTAFSVTTDAPDFITSGNSATVQITFSPENAGDFFETVRIANNVQNENPYTFAISGTGIDHIPPDFEDPVVNLSEMELKGILMYPNPSSGIINLDFSACKALKISISDISGNVLMEKLVTSRQEKIDLSHYSKGMYVINIQTENEVIVSKIIKK